MKRISLLLVILFISVLSTACVNNLAIQKLNDSAQSYIDKGDAESAICRLESSLELDSNVFETRYNLGIAYLKAEQFKNAIDMLNKALELRPDFVDIYYSIAIATDEINFAEIEKIKDPQIETEGKDIITEEKTVVPQEYKKLSDEDKAIITQKVNESIEAYQKYLELKPDAEEKSSIESRIASLNNLLNFDVDLQ